MYATYLRTRVESLATDVQARYAESNQNGLLAKLRAASDRLTQAERDLREGKRPTGDSNAAYNQLGAFVNQLAALEMPEELRQQWTARAEAIRQDVTALSSTLQ